MARQISRGTVHKLPADLRKELWAHAKARVAWESITPLARNEWICWVEDAKKAETRENRVGRTITELMEGMRRPCCWIGCIHRKDKPMSPSIRGILNKRKR